MARIKLSREAAAKAITYSNDAREQLLANIGIMDNNVNAEFSGLQDPAFKQYLEMSENMQDQLKQIGAKLEEISDYCESVIQWIDSYNNI